MTSNKIILINAKSSKKTSEKERIYFPLKLLYLGTILRNSGYDAKLYDLIVADNIDFNEIKKKPPLFVLISCTTKTLPSAIDTADSIKNINSHIPVVMEGLHALHFPEQVVQDKSFDIALTGEGEGIILLLANALLNKTELSKIPGIIYNTGNSTIKNKSEDLINLDDLPLINYELIDIQKYLYRKVDFILTDHSIKKIIRLSFSRGCPYNCPYCLYKSYPYRKMPLERCIKEINYITDKFDPDILFFDDATFFADKIDTINFLEVIRNNRSKYRFKIICTARANYFNDNYISKSFIEKYKDIILFWDVGGETANENLLKEIDKKITLDDLKNVADYCGKTETKAGFSFMLGMPDEHVNDMIETIKFIEKLKKLSKNNLLITYQFYQPLGTTRWSEKAVSLGYNRPKSLRDWEKQFDKKVGTISPTLLPWIKSIELLEYLMILVNYHINTNLRRNGLKDRLLMIMLFFSWKIRKTINHFDHLWELKFINKLGYRVFDNNFKI